MHEIENILALSAHNETETSGLSRKQLLTMLDRAYHWSTFGEGKDAYIICFDQDADYDNDNFRWFKERYKHFVYVDRIVVANHARGKGLARHLYQDLIQRAASDEHQIIVCEINLEPPNPASHSFHANFGFVEVGQAQTASGKTVSYQRLAL
jgi:uncharacterized protein